MSERGFSAIIFDLDGTLTDPGAGIVAAIRTVLATLGVNAPPRTQLAWCVGPPLREIFTRLLEPAGKLDLVDQAAALYLQTYAQSAESTAYPGVARMLTELRDASARLFVVTSKNTAAADRILGLCTLRRFFDEVAGNGRLDDKTDLVRDLIDRHRLDRAATAMVGDRAHDVVAARLCGLFALGVLYGYGTSEELAAAGADRLCDTPAAVARALLDPDANP